MLYSQDHLYCNHTSCGRKFCSESSLEKHRLVFHGRPTCEACGARLKKSSKHRCVFTHYDHLLADDYPPPDTSSDTGVGYSDDFERLLEGNNSKFSSFDVAGHEQEFQLEGHHRYSDYNGKLYDEDYDRYPVCDSRATMGQSPQIDFEWENVEIYTYSEGYENYSERYRYDDDDYSFEDGIKVASPVPLHIHLSQALTRLIEKYGDVIPCEHEDSFSEGDSDQCNDNSSDDQGCAE